MAQFNFTLDYGTKKTWASFETNKVFRTLDITDESDKPTLLIIMDDAHEVETTYWQYQADGKTVKKNAQGQRMKEAVTKEWVQTEIYLTNEEDIAKFKALTA